MARNREVIEDTEKTVVFKVEGYIQVDFDLSGYDDTTHAVKEVKEDIISSLEDNGIFKGNISYQPGKKLKVTTELVDDNDF